MGLHVVVAGRPESSVSETARALDAIGESLQVNAVGPAVSSLSLAETVRHGHQHRQQ